MFLEILLGIATRCAHQLCRTPSFRLTSVSSNCIKILPGDINSSVKTLPQHSRTQEERHHSATDGYYHFFRDSKREFTDTHLVDCIRHSVASASNCSCAKIAQPIVSRIRARHSLGNVQTNVNNRITHDFLVYSCLESCYTVRLAVSVTTKYTFFVLPHAEIGSFTCALLENYTSVLSSKDKQPKDGGWNTLVGCVSGKHIARTFVAIKYICLATANSVHRDTLYSKLRR